MHFIHYISYSSIFFHLTQKPLYDIIFLNNTGQEKASEYTLIEK